VLRLHLTTPGGLVDLGEAVREAQITPKLADHFREIELLARSDVRRRCYGI
jgi:hypothetical protein